MRMPLGSNCAILIRFIFIIIIIIIIIVVVVVVVIIIIIVTMPSGRATDSKMIVQVGSICN